MGRKEGENSPLSLNLPHNMLSLNQCYGQLTLVYIEEIAHKIRHRQRKLEFSGGVYLNYYPLELQFSYRYIL